MRLLSCVLFLLIAVGAVPSAAQQASIETTESAKTVACADRACLNDVLAKQNSAVADPMRDLCLTDGLNWRDPDVTYVWGPKGAPVERCFATEWHTFKYGGPY